MNALARSGLVLAVTLVTLAGPALAADPAPAQSPAPTLRRFALIASANDGGVGRTRLRFADSDARAVADVLQSLGGLAEPDLVLIPAANRARLAAAFDRLKAQMTSAGGVRRELFVYYSGHSDEEGLLLGNERIGYRELRSLIDQSGADVRIAILDSCASGALISLKGVRRKPSFLSDLSTNTRGHAFLTASAADEAAQESERVGAAFFTHYLVSGLRGAADNSRDGRVTLDEAYRYAYHETLRRTERTAAGPQHPAYDIQLSGRGDFVMTDLRASGSALVFDEKVFGRIYVRDRNGRLLVELHKEPLYPVELGLAPGEYHVALDADGQPSQASVTLVDGRRARLGLKEFTPVASAVSMARGGRMPAIPTPVPTATPVIADGVAAEGNYRRVPFEAMLVPGLRTGGRSAPVLNNFVIGVMTQSDALAGWQLGLAGNIVADRARGVQLAVGFNYNGGTMQGAQIASGANIVRGHFLGAQIASGANIALGDFEGAQIANVNWAERSFLGPQLGVVNHVGGDMRGLQAGVVGWTRGFLRGPQMGVLNVAGGINGPQLGVVNLSSLVDGAQVGVFNYGREVSGAQVGVLNIASRVDGASIGLINLVGDGYHPVAVWSSDLLPLNLGVKLGSRYFYTVLGFGVRQSEEKGTLYGTSVGLGGHMPFKGRFFADLDVVGTQLAVKNDWTPDNEALGSVRLTFGYQFFKHLAVTLTPTYNIYVRHKDGPDRKPGWDIMKDSEIHGNYEVRFFPGLQFGLQL